MTDLLAGQAAPAVSVEELTALIEELTGTADSGASRDDAWLTAEDRDWLAGNDPEQSPIAALLHTEVVHDGACYGRRSDWALLIGAGTAAIGELGYAGGHYLVHGHLALLPAAIGIPFAIAAAVLPVLAAIAHHALWHHDEAPWIHNVVIEDDDHSAVPDGC